MTRLTRTVGFERAETAYFVIKDNMEIAYPGEADLHEAMDLVARYRGELSLSDCLFVRFMAPRDIILSFDSGFDGKVRRLPSP